MRKSNYNICRKISKIEREFEFSTIDRSVGYEIQLILSSKIKVIILPLIRNQILEQILIETRTIL